MESDSDPDNPDILADFNQVPAKKTKVSDYFDTTVDARESESDVSVLINTEVNIPSPGTSSASETKDKDISAEDLEKVQKPQSLLWLFYTKVDGNKAKCNKCSAIRSTPNSTTTTLRSHLKKDHQKCYQEYQRLENIKEKLNQSTTKKPDLKKQTLLKDSLKGVFKFDSKSKKAKTINRAVAKFICKGAHPYSIVEEPAFLQLIHLLEPHYNVPSRTTFSRQIIPNLYRELKEEIKKELLDSNKLESLSITTDLWTSRAGDAFMAFTLQFINDDFVMKNITLDCLPFPGKHDAPALQAKIKLVLAAWEIDGTEISKYIAADNGRNIAKALREADQGDNVGLGENNTDSDKDNQDSGVEIRGNNEKTDKLWIHISCYNHTMQLAVDDTKKSQKASSVFDKVSTHVARYNKSRTARESLSECQKEHKLPQHCLIQMVVTRWDSEFFMLERYFEQKAAIISEQSNASVDSLSVQEWKLVEGYVQVLKTVADFTADMGSHSKPTLSMVIPVLFEIKTSLKNFISKAPKGNGIMFARSLLTNIEARFPADAYFNRELYQSAMIIDPRFKHVILGDKLEAASLLERRAASKKRQHVKRGLIPPPTPNEPSLETQVAGTSKPKSKWGNFHKKSSMVMTTAGDHEDELDIIKKEVETYLQLPVIGEEDDPLEWWRSNQTAFPSLTPVARELLSIAATETDSERVFSVGGNVVTNKRTNLLPQHVQETVFCHDNLPD